MTHLSTSKVLPLLFLICGVGCNAAPNVLTVTKEGVTAHGHISNREEQIDGLDIYPDKLSPSDQQKLWIGFSSGKRIPLQSITKEFIEEIAIPSTRYYSKPSEPDYFIDGYDFEFRSGHLTKISVNRYGWPPRNVTAFVYMGSSNGTSLKLPCSANEFESVFGAVTVGRGYVE